MKSSSRMLLSRGIALCAICAWGYGAEAASVDTSDGGKPWEKRQVKTVKAARAPDQVNPYGGSEKHTLKATGFFYVTEKSNRWWMVDPDGHLFIMKGVNSVEGERVGRYDSKEWAVDTFEVLKNAGFNTLGRWSDADLFKQVGHPVPWCSTTSFMATYANLRSAQDGENGYPNDTIPVFDEAWPAFCERYAKEQVADWVDDPWLIGHFSDNELPFRPDALSNYLALPEHDTGYKAAVIWMRENKYKQSKVKDERVQSAFLEMMTRRYFETVAAALKKADPNHLYIGSRLHGRNICEPVIRAAGACDLISINYYHRWLPEEERMEDWVDWSGSPFFVSEFYAMKLAGKETEAEGAGFRVLNHEDAVAFYHTYTAALLKDIPSCVGWHWFKYADDTPEWQKGIVGNDGTAHQQLLDGMKVVNEQAYSLRGLR